MRPKIVIALNSAWNFVNFRSGLIRSLIASGYDVVAVAPHDKYADRVTALGCRFVAFPMDNQGIHPGRDLWLLLRFYKLLAHERPHVYLGYTVKPNIYGSLAAQVLGIPVINNIAGLGSVFIKKNWLSSLVRILYRIALFRSTKIFFQNHDDLALFLNEGIVAQEKADRLPGSGIDLAHFKPSPLPAKQPLRFLLVARMLWDKGVAEYVEAARILSHRGINVEMCLLGFLDVRNPAAISRSQMDEWVTEGTVRYLGVSDNVEIELAAADCIVLPSFYREGVPRTLLEAAAMGRPIITTDTVGCREVVDDGVNGFLVRPRDAIDLADKIELMSAIPSDARAEMGRRSRQKVELEFDEKIVISKYLEEIETNLHSRSISINTAGIN